MRQIVKQQEPASLTAHRLTPHSHYDNYPAKEELRDALVGEQRALCCYCMARIRSDVTSMKIEHWRSRANHPEDQLRYHNLLGGCRGGEGYPLDLQHCDTRKADADLRWNPADRTHQIETRIAYTTDGGIRANDPVFDAQLNNVLNLNLPQIKNNRKGVLTALLDWSRRERRRLRAPVPRVSIERAIEQWTSADGDLPPYCRVAVWWLEQKLARMG